MFEKEAEEWVNQEYDNSYFADSNFGARNDAKQAYLAGAEFGYNKAKKELEAENADLKSQNKELREKVHWWKKEVNVAHRSRADEMDKLYIDNNALKAKVDKIKNYLAYNIPHELINAATNEIWKML